MFVYMLFCNKSTSILSHHLNVIQPSFLPIKIYKFQNQKITSNTTPTIPIICLNLKENHIFLLILLNHIKFPLSLPIYLQTHTIQYSSLNPVNASSKQTPSLISHRFLKAPPSQFKETNKKIHLSSFLYFWNFVIVSNKIQ